MTKRWFSILLVLTLLATSFVGLAEGPVEKGTKPAISFVAALEELDMTGKAEIENVTLGTFKVDNGSAAAANTAIKTAIGDSLDTTFGDGEWDLTGGVLTATVTHPAATDEVKKFSVSTTQASVSADYNFALIGLDNEPTWPTHPQPVEQDIVKLVFENPVDKVTVSGEKDGADSDTVLVTGGAVVKGAVTDVLTLTATASFENTKYTNKTPASPITYTWESDNEDVATVDPTTNTAKITTVGSGVAIITATATNAKGSAKGTFRVTVDAVNPDTIVISKTYPSTESPFAQNTVVQLLATVTNEVTDNATEKAVKWESSNTSVATVDANGLVSIVAATGTADITATSTVVSTVKDTYHVAAKSSSGMIAPVLKIDDTILGGSATEDEAGKELEIISINKNAQIYYTIGNDTTSPAEVKAAGTLYTGPIPLNENKAYVVKAVATSGDIVSDITSSTITVTIVPTKITLDQTEVTVKGKDQVIELKATITPAGVADDTITWDYTDVGSPNNIFSTTESDADGHEGSTLKLVTTGAASNGVTITATTHNGETASCVIKVEKVDVTGVTITPASLSLPLDQTAKIEAVVAPANASDQRVTFESQDQAIVEVDANGIVSVASGAEVGESTYIVATTTDGSKKATCQVTLTAATAQVQAPIFSETDGTKIPGGGTGKLTLSCLTPQATIYYTTDGTDPVHNGTPGTKNQSVTLDLPTDKDSVTVKAYARLDDNTKLPSAVVTATYDLRVAVEKVEFKKSGTVYTEDTIAGSQTIAVGTYTVVIDPSAASNKKLTVVSSDETVATVKATQNDSSKHIYDLEIKTLKPGVATLTATTEDGAKTATLKLTVTEVKPLATWMQITNTTSVSVDETATYEVTWSANYPSDPTVTWSITAGETYASIDAKTGVLTGKVASPSGAVTIRATSNADKTVYAEKTGISIVASTGAVAAITVTAKDDEGTAVTVESTGTTTVTKRITVSATSATVGATIRYTTDGKAPTETSTVFPADGLVLTESTYLRLIAVATGKTSVFANKNFSINIATTEIELDKDAITLAKGDVAELTVKFTPDYAVDKAINWVSSDQTVATVDNGVVTALKTGTTTITAELASNSGVNDTCAVTVSPVEPTGIEWIPGSLNLNIGDVATVAKIKVSPSDASYDAVVIRASAGADDYLTSAPTTTKGFEQISLSSITKAGTVTFTATVAGKSATLTVNIAADPVLAPTETANIPTFEPSKPKEFKAKEGESLTAELGTFLPASGETLDQTFYYNTVAFSFTTAGFPASASVNVDTKTGKATLSIPDVGKTSFDDFAYNWTLSTRDGRGSHAGQSLLNGNVRTVTGNSLTITLLPTEIRPTLVNVPAQEIDTEKSESIEMGSIINIDDFKANGINLTAKENVTEVTAAAKATAKATKGFSASIDSTGKILLNVDKPEAGVYDVYVSVSAPGFTTVKTNTVRFTITKAPVTEYKIIVGGTTPSTESAGTIYVPFVKKGTFQLTLNEGAGSGWAIAKAGKKKTIATISSTGLVTMKKKAGAFTVTAVNEKGETVTQLFSTKIAKTLKVQKRNAKDTKWVAVSKLAKKGLPVVLGAPQKIRVLAKAPSKAPVLGLTWASSDETIFTVVGDATGAAVVTPVALGSATLTATTFNNVSLTFTVNVVATAVAEDEEPEVEVKVGKVTIAKK